MTMVGGRWLGWDRQVVVDREVRRGISRRGDLADLGRSSAAPVHGLGNGGDRVAEFGEIGVLGWKSAPSTVSIFGALFPYGEHDEGFAQGTGGAGTFT